MKVKAHEGEIHRLPSTKLTAVMNYDPPSKQIILRHVLKLFETQYFQQISTIFNKSCRRFMD